MARRSNKKGRSEGGGRFLALPHTLLHSPSFRQLSCPARAVLIEIAAIYDGQNNGRIGAGVRWLAERCKVSKDTISRAIQELEDGGFIAVMSKGSFREHQKRASEYRITWRKCDVTDALPTHPYLRH